MVHMTVEKISKDLLTSRTCVWLSLPIVCLLFLFGMTVVAIPAQAQTRAYVANSSSSTVSVIATSTNTVVATIPVGANPLMVAITPDGTRAYVTNVSSGTVSVIDTATNTVVATIPVGVNPIGVAITPGVGPPTNKDQCKKGGWQVFTIPRKFKNQGDCVSFVNTGK
jgi:YVTN family beta-propeller protein